jgi:hypothetical protein
MTPKRYMVALYKGTKTLGLAAAEGRFILQLLAEGDHGLVAFLRADECRCLARPRDSFPD